MPISPRHAADLSGATPFPERSFSVPASANDRRLSVPGPSPSADAQLVPTEPPGRITRKARQFEAEIAQLRAQGYTLAAIRRMLAAAGVQVSLTTIRRELNRPAAPKPFKVIAATPVAASPAATSAASAPTQRSVPHPVPGPAAGPTPQSGPVKPALLDPPSGKDLAAAFARSKSSNPMIRAKEQS